MRQQNLTAKKRESEKPEDDRKKYQDTSVVFYYEKETMKATHEQKCEAGTCKSESEQRGGNWKKCDDLKRFIINLSGEGAMILTSRRGRTVYRLPLRIKFLFAASIVDEARSSHAAADVPCPGLGRWQVLALEFGNLSGLEIRLQTSRKQQEITKCRKVYPRLPSAPENSTSNMKKERDAQKAKKRRCCHHPPWNCYLAKPMNTLNVE